MRPGKLYTLQYDRRFEFAGISACGKKISWDALKVFKDGTKKYIMVIEPFTLNPKTFMPSRIGTNPSGQAAILATWCVRGMPHMQELKHAFENGRGIPGWKFLSSQGIIWISENDIKEIKWS